MTNKEYCDYTLRLRKDIQAKEALIASLNLSAESDTPGYDSVSVQNNGSIRPMADVTDVKMDLQAVLTVEKQILRNMLYVIAKAILFLNSPDCVTVLEKLYIDGLVVADAMRELGLAKATLYRRRNQGLSLMRIPDDALQAAENLAESRHFDFRADNRSCSEALKRNETN